MKYKNKGFTLIELLVVIAIIGLLASIVSVALNNARQKSRIAKRLADLKSVQTALELYYNDNNAYPSTSSAWRSQCAAWGSYSASNVIPGLVPTYISTLPADPSMVSASNYNCYLYRSDGSGYKFMDFNIYDMTQADIDKQTAFLEAYYNGTTCAANTSYPAMSVYSTNWRCAN